MQKLLTPDNAIADRCAYRLTLRGRVQGFGVRPAIARLAQDAAVDGWVSNGSEGVAIHIEGRPLAVERFRSELSNHLPLGVRVNSIQAAETAVADLSDFRIRTTHCHGPLSAHVPPDIAVCSECLAEVTNLHNRRQGYLFTTCNQCGPRYSLIAAMPYDRPTTGMVYFAPCEICRNEYISVTDRRFHSQTNSCPSCGPRLWLTDAAGNEIADREAAVQRAVAAILEGNILAVKGIGGYQLVVDATSPTSVPRLRRSKQRFGKPLAMMVSNMRAAEQLAFLDEDERQALTDSSNPIVVARLQTPSPLAHEVVGGLNTVGIMLPTTPLHNDLVRRTGRPLIVTSGNVEGEPLSFETATVGEELLSTAELLLHHDRPILRPIDDSVVRIIAGRPTTIRLARGLAPLPLALDCDQQILAVGGHQKAAIALSNGAQAVLGPHVCDLENEAARARYLAHIESFCGLYGALPQFIAHDLHPDYFTSRWASEQAARTMAVQHHHAHVAAGMLEHGWLDRQVLGVAWDGTGYGTEGTIWGGEFLLSTATDFQRVGSLRPFVLPGGELAVRQPWRVAVALVHQALGSDVAARLRFQSIPQQQVERVARLIDRPALWPHTTSAGRLFDGVASLVLGIASAQFEGQPAMLLESACDESTNGEYPLPICDGHPDMLDWRPTITAMVNDVSVGIDPAAIAMRFHRTLAAGIVAMINRFELLPVVLAGGCFNNRILTELVAERRAGRLQPLGLPGIIPVNDGGLAAGQLAVAVARLRNENLH